MAYKIGIYKENSNFGMKEVSKSEARSIYKKQNKLLYLLYDNNTKAIVESNDDIIRHAHYGMKFGVEYKVKKK